MKLIRNEFEKYLTEISSIIERRLAAEVGEYEKYSLNTLNSSFGLSGRFDYNEPTLTLLGLIPNKDIIEKELKQSISKFLEENFVSYPLIITTEYSLGCYPTICLKFEIEERASLAGIFSQSIENNLINV